MPEQDLTTLLLTSMETTTAERQVGEDTPAPDAHPLALWDKRTKKLGDCKKNGEGTALKEANTLTNEAQVYAQRISQKRWFAHCESFN